ncbi:unnamed protein product [Spirodela intermedia]|uniref:Uncharacterized protein n=1 Tax=Spirodela intermedia TaxID=51605 RepID=A0A7I8I7B4_SPIIN|nr:unnamed protein product [Spirodela intermedia]CAA6653435.1 unnamed protein product [Spirodela intermedia]
MLRGWAELAEAAPQQQRRCSARRRRREGAARLSLESQSAGTPPIANQLESQNTISTRFNPIYAGWGKRTEAGSTKSVRPI